MIKIGVAGSAAVKNLALLLEQACLTPKLVPGSGSGCSIPVLNPTEGTMG